MSTSIGRVPRSFGTHNGAFHADEVTACALLIFFGMIEKDLVIRTREADRLATCDFVCDVGGEYDPSSRRFDHHQAEYNGQLSSAGMILNYLRDEKVITPELFEYLNRSLVHGIDQIDNGLVEPVYGFASFSSIVSGFVPIHYDSTEKEQDEAFDEALGFVLGCLERLVKRYEYLISCKSHVKEVFDTMDECLMFDKAMPWLEAFFELGGEKHKAEFVIMPSGNHWKLRGIPPNNERRMEVRHPLPEEWAGKMGEDLIKASGIEGAIFCHKGRFISVWETKEAALKALKFILEKK